MQAWADHLLPDIDVWFWDEDPLDLNVSGCVVMPRANYLKHPTFRDIRYVSAYLHWKMPHEVTHVIVGGPAWITGISASDRQRVLGKQVGLKRGLVYPRSHFDELPDGLDTHTVDDHVVLCHAAWELVPGPVRRLALLREQSRWDDAECFDLPYDAPDHIRSIASSFGIHDGANCLSTTSVCLTGETWLRDLWMF